MEDLIARVAAGDRHAFENLYRELADTAYLIAHATLQDSAQAEEVAQEVFVEIWQSAARYSPGRGTVRGWVRSIARNRAIDRVRTTQSARVRDHVSADRDDGVNPEELALARIEQRRLAAAIRLLPTEHREVVVLTYFDDLTNVQAAAALGIPLGTVKSRLSAAVRHLRRILET